MTGILAVTLEMREDGSLSSIPKYTAINNHGNTTNVASNTNIAAAWAQRRTRTFRGLFVTLGSESEASL